MRRFLSILLVVSLLLVGCTPTEKPYVPTGDALYNPATSSPSDPEVQGQDLKLCYYEELGLNPYQVANYTNRSLFNLLYQGLFATDRDYNVVPILCARYTVSRDMRTYVFYPEKATFSDGSPLTAQDVAASLEYARTSPVYSGRLRYVTEISLTEDGGVKITLQISYAELPLLLDIPIVKEADLEAEYPTGTGAYRISSGISGRGLLKNEKWWCKATLHVTAAYVPLVAVESNEQIRDAFELQGVGMVCTDPGSGTYVDYRGDHEIWEMENGIFLYLGCNEESDIFKIPEMRQALTYAIDRSALAESIYDGFATPATLPADPASPYYNHTMAAQYSYKPEIFQQAVIDAGMEGQMVRILVNKQDSSRLRAARAIADMMVACGMKATVMSMNPGDYAAHLIWGDYDLHLGQTMLSPTMDLSAFFAADGSLNHWGMSDTALLALCWDAMANIGNYTTLYKAVLKDAMLCPLLFRSYAIYAKRGLMSDLTPARDQIFFYDLGKTMEDVLDKG